MAEDATLQTGGAEAQQRSSVSPAPDAILERNTWLDVMADVQAEMNRRFEVMNRRISRVESRRGGLFGEMPSEVRGLLVMLTLYVGISYILPMIGELVAAKWRSHS